MSSMYFQYCIFCLETNVRMYNFHNTTICEAYSKLMREAVLNKDQHICVICATLLVKYTQFHTKCVKAQEVLNRISELSIPVTKEMIDSIDRHEHKLSSNLSLTVAKVDFCDSIIIKDEELDNFNVKQEEKNRSNMSNKIQGEINTSNMSYKIQGETNTSNTSYKIQEETNTSNMSYKIECIYDTIPNLHYNDISKIDNDHIKFEQEQESDYLNKAPELCISNDGNDNCRSSSDSVFNTAFKNELEKMKRKRKTVKRKRNTSNRNCWQKPGLNCEEFKTVVMTQEEAAKEMLLRQEKNNYVNGSYKCDLCYRGFDFEKTYLNHVKIHTDAYGKYECDYCHIKSFKKEGIRRHIDCCHRTKIVCNKCPYKCYSTSQALTHLKFHSGKTYSCDDCGRVFRMPNSLSTHKRLYHKMGAPCDLCGEVLGTQNGLAAHKRNMHADETNNFEGPKCEECNVHFASKRAWKRHLVWSKKHNVSNGCDICGETFTDKSALRRHRRAFHRYKTSRKQQYIWKMEPAPSQCSICNKSVFSRQEYNKHLKYEHPESELNKANDYEPNKKSVICEICGKIYNHQSLLIYHQRQHTGERPYKCAVCGKSFKEPASYSTHKRTHTLRTRLQCDMCPKQYLTKGSLAKHIKINHLGLRPFNCEICGKSFHNKYEVNLHSKYVHEKVPWPKRDRSKRS